MADNDDNEGKGKAEAGKTPTRMLRLIQGEEARRQDSFEFLRDLFADDRLDPEAKAVIFETWRTRFRNRRTMAYISIYAILGSFIVFGALLVLDGILMATGTSVPDASGGVVSLTDPIKENRTLLIWFEGFFVSIVGFYFGASSLAPNS